MLSLDAKLKMCKMSHTSFLNCINLDVKEYINPPKPSDNEAWKALDDQLYEE